MLSVAPKGQVPGSPEEMVSHAPELEALPIIAQRVLALARDPHASVGRIGDLLGTDQALASSVLRYANGALEMPGHRIVSLSAAVARIGQRTLSDVLMRACAGPLLDRGLPPYALPRRIAWRHAATVSLAARSLAQLLRPGVGKEEASIAGLLHDVGKMVLTSVVPEAAAKAVSIARSRRMPVWQAEIAVLGFDHAAVGGALLRSWGLPSALADAVAFHHRPSGSASPTLLASIIQLADAAAAAVGAVGGGGACPLPGWDPAAAEALGATTEQLSAFMDNLLCVDEGDQ